MSVATRRAIYGKMAGDSTLVALLGTPPTGFSKAIYYQVAPKGTTGAYVIFQKQAGTPRYTFKTGHAAIDDELWLIKGVGEAGSADEVDNIASRLDALLTDGALTISGATQLELRRESDVDYSEEVDGVIHRHSGSLYRLLYQAP